MYLSDLFKSSVITALIHGSAYRATIQGVVMLFKAIPERNSYFEVHIELCNDNCVCTLENKLELCEALKKQKLKFDHPSILEDLIIIDHRIFSESSTNNAKYIISDVNTPILAKMETFSLGYVLFIMILWWKVEVTHAYNDYSCDFNYAVYLTSILLQITSIVLQVIIIIIQAVLQRKSKRINPVNKFIVAFATLIPGMLSIIFRNLRPIDSLFSLICAYASSLACITFIIITIIILMKFKTSVVYEDTSDYLAVLLSLIKHVVSNKFYTASIFLIVFAMFLSPSEALCVSQRQTNVLSPLDKLTTTFSYEYDISSIQARLNLSYQKLVDSQWVDLSVTDGIYYYNGSLNVATGILNYYRCIPVGSGPINLAPKICNNQTVTLSLQYSTVGTYNNSNCLNFIVKGLISYSECRKDTLYLATAYFSDVNIYTHATIPSLLWSSPNSFFNTIKTANRQRRQAIFSLFAGFAITAGYSIVSEICLSCVDAGTFAAFRDMQYSFNTNQININMQFLASLGSIQSNFANYVTQTNNNLMAIIVSINQLKAILSNYMSVTDVNINLLANDVKLIQSLNNWKLQTQNLLQTLHNIDLSLTELIQMNDQPTIRWQHFNMTGLITETLNIGAQYAVQNRYSLISDKRVDASYTVKVIILEKTHDNDNVNNAIILVTLLYYNIINPRVSIISITNCYKEPIIQGGKIITYDFANSIYLLYEEIPRPMCASLTSETYKNLNCLNPDCNQAIQMRVCTDSEKVIVANNITNGLVNINLPQYYYNEVSTMNFTSLLNWFAQDPANGLICFAGTEPFVLNIYSLRTNANTFSSYSKIYTPVCLQLNETSSLNFVSVNYKTKLVMTVSTPIKRDLNVSIIPINYIPADYALPVYDSSDLADQLNLTLATFKQYNLSNINTLIMAQIQINDQIANLTINNKNYTSLINAVNGILAGVAAIPALFVDKMKTALGLDVPSMAAVGISVTALLLSLIQLLYACRGNISKAASLTPQGLVASTALDVIKSKN